MRKTGFTLVELLVVVVIIAILAVIALTLYTNYVRSTRRSDGMDTITSIALAEERYRTNNTTYGTLAQVWASVTASPGGYYTLAISGNTATAYTVTATAVGDQANDVQDGTACNVLTYSVSNGAISRSPADCWPQ